MDRELVNISKEDFDYTDDTKGAKFKWEKQTYTVVAKERVNGDGEWWRVIAQRKSDKKFFDWMWGYLHGSGRYYFEGPLREVFETKEIKTIEVITYS